jgi:isoaspartyl peptidase/L-asparaginase-like protein (Ntn-hydrolase superfamily)
MKSSGQFLSKFVTVGKDVQQAVEQALAYMKQRVAGCGGLVALDSKSGHTGHYCTTERMAWASASHGLLRYGIEPSDTDVTTEQWKQDD